MPIELFTLLRRDALPWRGHSLEFVSSKLEYHQLLPVMFCVGFI